MRKTIKKGTKEGGISGSLTYETPTGLNSNYCLWNGMVWNGITSSTKLLNFVCYYSHHVIHFRNVMILITQA